MASTLRDLMRWSVKPAENVETATTPRINVLRGLAARATTPLLPDDYLKLLNPLWTARELRGEIVDVRNETADSATVTIKPGWGFSADYQPGQYVGIGLRVDGRWHWRSYSLTSVPRARQETASRSPSRRRQRAFCPRTWSTASSRERSFGSRPPRATSRFPTRRRRKFCSSAPAAASPR